MAKKSSSTPNQCRETLDVYAQEEMIEQIEELAKRFKKEREQEKKISHSIKQRRETLDPYSYLGVENQVNGGSTVS